LPAKEQRLAEVRAELERPDIWSNPSVAQSLGRERARLEREIEAHARLKSDLAEARELLDLAREEGDADTAQALAQDVAALERRLTELELARMFSGDMDASNAFMDIQAGSGGTEAQ